MTWYLSFWAVVIMIITILSLLYFMFILNKSFDNYHNFKFFFFFFSLLLLLFLLVHKLRPADIRVIAALGDSITVSKNYWLTAIKASNERPFLNFNMRESAYWYALLSQMQFSHICFNTPPLLTGNQIMSRMCARFPFKVHKSAEQGVTARLGCIAAQIPCYSGLATCFSLLILFSNQGVVLQSY